MASPFFFVAKKEKGALRPTQDYRELNKGTVKNTYPLPLILELLDKLKGAMVFTKLDLRNGYNNVRIKDGDQWKATFKTNRGLFEPTRHNLFLKLEKCEFDVTEVVFLGMVIRPGYIAMDPVKLAGIADWEPPQTVKGVRAFLGFRNFYRKFIGRYAHLTRPLNDLLQKNRKFNWTTQFMPDVDKPFVIEADASKWATGAVLRQKGTDGEWHSCGYLSKSFSPTERNYEIYDRELLAIYRALMEWCHYLMGGKFKVVKLNRRQARWSLFLSEFDLGLVHVPGKSISQADALSRRSNEQDDVDSNSEDIVVLPDRLFIKGIDLGLKDDIAERLGPDDFHKLALEQLLHQGMPPIKSALTDWKIEGDLLFFQNQVYVPNDIDLHRRIVQSIHETPGVGHPGQWNTIEQVQRDFWWPGMAKFIKAFVDSCVICQQSKINTHPTRTPIQPLQVTPNSFPFQVCTMDLITDLPECDGLDSILVVVDHSSTKGVIFTPCTKTTDATRIAEMLIQHLYKRFGLPDRIISD
uniref:Reverse transcriptase-rnase h-integrase n=1 Tax=Moniliophthora roreri TaxID=221103 RepID=A0A0W0FWU4_MONRR